jgi:hypothetical protein
VQSAGEDVFGGFVGHAHASPGAGDGKENFGEVQGEGLLLFEGKHEIAVALFRGGKRMFMGDMLPWVGGSGELAFGSSADSVALWSG